MEGVQVGDTIQWRALFFLRVPFAEMNILVLFWLLVLREAITTGHIFVVRRGLKQMDAIVGTVGRPPSTRLCSLQPTEQLGTACLKCAQWRLDVRDLDFWPDG